MRRLKGRRSVILCLALTLSCGVADGISAPNMVAERMGTVRVPWSSNSSIALLSDESTACVIDSYEVRVQCVDRSGDMVGVFGRKGEGPGEFGSLSKLVGGPDNTVGTVDTRLNRFSVFDPSGVLVTEVALPGAAFTLNPVTRFSTTLVGVSIVTFDPYVIEAGAGPGGLLAMFEVDLASGNVAREEVPPVDASVECGIVHYGFANSGGGWVYVACQGHMLFVGEDGEVAVLQAPTYTGELPNDRDVAALREASRTLGRFGGGWDREEQEEIRSTPKNYHLVFGQQKFDERGRLWIATQRDRDEFSYVDVYDTEEAAFVGSVRVHDRIEGFDLLGSTLVVVVERQLPPDDPDGIAERGVDWYDVSEWR